MWEAQIVEEKERDTGFEPATSTLAILAKLAPVLRFSHLALQGPGNFVQKLGSSAPWAHPENGMDARCSRSFMPEVTCPVNR
jgi:hypothetical protein